MDVQLTRVQFGSKLTAQITFCQASLSEALNKANAFYESQNALYEKFQELKSKGITEDRVLDKALGLGTDAGILKCFYTLERRSRASLLALGQLPDNEEILDTVGENLVQHEDAGAGAGGAEGAAAEAGGVADGGDGGTGSEAAESAKADAAQERLQKWIGADPMLSSFAAKAVCLPFLKKTDHFDDCFSRQDFKDKLKVMQERASQTKTIAASLRKCIAEMDSLIKARLIS